MNKQVKKVLLSLDLEYSLFGIKTNEPSYKLAYYLNKDMNITFQRDQDIDILDKNQYIYLARYIYYDSYHEQDWTLVSNQSKIYKHNDFNLGIFSNQSYTLSYLIPEYKMFNYILKIDGKLEKKDKISKIKNISIINMISKINKSLIKNKDKLIF
tara:strand:- start:49 stop:513 length:465 start_codon:yes stop_codon:yes gene_type:complete